MTFADLLAKFKKQPVGFVCGIICVICGVLLYFRSSKIGENQADYEAKSAEATKITANVRNAEKLPAQVEEIQALAKELDGRLIHASQLAVNLQYFYKLEAETEVKLLDVRQNGLPKGTKTLYLGVPFTVSVQGSFKQVLAFLQKLETGPHFCHFTSVNFGRAGTSSEGKPTGADSVTTLNLNLELLGVP